MTSSHELFVGLPAVHLSLPGAAAGAVACGDVAAESAIGDVAHVTCPLCRVVGAARAARFAPGLTITQAIDAADAAAQGEAVRVGISLPGEDVCLHGHYDLPCTICEEIFG